MSDKCWSKPVKSVPREHMEAIGKLRPTFLPNRFADVLQVRQIAFIDQLEHRLVASQLEQVRGPGMVSVCCSRRPCGPSLEQILAGLEELSNYSSDVGRQTLEAGSIPDDVYYSVAIWAATLDTCLCKLW